MRRLISVIGLALFFVLTARWDTGRRRQRRSRPHTPRGCAFPFFLGDELYGPNTKGGSKTGGGSAIASE